MIEDLKNLKMLIDDDNISVNYLLRSDYRDMLSATIGGIIENNDHCFTPDASKLLDAGYTLIRTQNDPHIIKYKKGDIREWRTYYGPYPTKAARDRVFKELLEDNKTIQA